MMIAQEKSRSTHDLTRRSGLLVAGAVSLLVATPATMASAQTRAVLQGAANGYYYTLPNVVRIRPGTMRILHSRCDGSYPMDEFEPCGDVTGGPVGGRGS